MLNSLVLCALPLNNLDSSITLAAASIWRVVCRGISVDDSNRARVDLVHICLLNSIADLNLMQASHIVLMHLGFRGRCSKLLVKCLARTLHSGFAVLSRVWTGHELVMLLMMIGYLPLGCLVAVVFFLAVDLVQTHASLLTFFRNLVGVVEGFSHFKAILVDVVELVRNVWVFEV